MSKCTQCQGDGYVTHALGEGKCSICRGTGYVEKTARATPTAPLAEYRFAEYRRGVREAFNVANMINANRTGNNLHSGDETCAYIVRSLAELANGGSVTPADHKPVPIYLGRIETSDGNEAWIELSDEDRKYWRDTVRSVYLAAPEASTPTARTLPADLTPPVRHVLSLMLWQTLPIANALRATGRHINRKTEDEQAAALYWLLGIALEHGENWEQAAARALHKLLSEKKGI